MSNEPESDSAMMVMNLESFKFGVDHGAGYDETDSETEPPSSTSEDHASGHSDCTFPA